MSHARETLIIPRISLEWSEWVAWDALKLDARFESGIRVPNGKSGVYEVKYKDTEERLTIGKTSNLRFRIKQCLIKGKSAHSAGEDIRAKEDTSKLIVRWATTDRPAAAEEELHKRYRDKFGRFPKYTDHT